MAIITCSVILGLYIIVAIVCVKLDIMDVRRISTIPLCGKDGSFKYEVTTVTGRQVGAGIIDAVDRNNSDDSNTLDNWN